MKKLLLILALFCIYSPANAQPAIKTSRAAADGCQWKPFTSKELGVSLIAETCPGSPDPEYVVQGNSTYEHFKKIGIFSKPADQDIRQAIRELALSNVSEAEKTGCIVQKQLPNHMKNPRKEIFEIEMTNAYEARIDNALPADERGTPLNGCGNYREAEGITYFEYHPYESRTKFAYVYIGGDAPPFDEESLKFTGKTK